MNSLESLYKAAVIEHRSGRISAAESLCRHIIQTDQRFARAWELLGIIHQQHGDWRRAVEFIEHAIRLEPHWGGFYHDLGNVLWTAHQHQAAEEALRKALVLMPNSSVVRAML